MIPFLINFTVLVIVAVVTLARPARPPRRERRELDAYRQLVDDLAVLAAEAATVGDPFASLALHEINSRRKALRK